MKEGVGWLFMIFVVLAFALLVFMKVLVYGRSSQDAYNFQIVPTTPRVCGVPLAYVFSSTLYAIKNVLFISVIHYASVSAHFM